MKTKNVGAKMKTRRDFLKAGFAVGAGFSLGNLSGLFGAEAGGAAGVAKPGELPELVAVRDGTRAAMLDRALAVLGGMGTFVKKGQVVVVKPNIGWDRLPEQGANTHPELVARLVELCLKEGAKEVIVFDNTCDPWEKTYATSGIEKAAKAAGARMVNGKDEKLYRKFTMKGTEKLTGEQLVMGSWLDADVVINVPVLKHHGGARMTACMKNLMGIVWDRKFFHSNDLQRCIAESVLIRKPDLNVLDAYHPMLRNGPRGKSTNDVVEMRTLLVSRDIVAIDAAASKMLGHAEDGIGHVKIGAEMGLGKCDLSQVRIERISMG